MRPISDTEIMTLETSVIVKEEQAIISSLNSRGKCDKLKNLVT
jgi:hypothetical protein